MAKARFAGAWPAVLDKANRGICLVTNLEDQEPGLSQRVELIIFDMSTSTSRGQPQRAVGRGSTETHRRGGRRHRANS